MDSPRYLHVPDVPMQAGLPSQDPANQRPAQDGRNRAPGHWRMAPAVPV